MTVADEYGTKDIFDFDKQFDSMIKFFVLDVLLT
jgi:hypothetical protein